MALKFSFKLLPWRSMVSQNGSVADLFLTCSESPFQNLVSCVVKGSILKGLTLLVLSCIFSSISLQIGTGVVSAIGILKQFMFGRDKKVTSAAAYQTKLLGSVIIIQHSGML
ncbi:hypothetical protein BHE74_00059891 [Ensete ventricosum]|nr:hypothetical protein GW17_00009403 [Ensete ventricosum]RWW35205.1 hypothetical protein BHE74_00059891 [Ensete ventricosum]